MTFNRSLPATLFLSVTLVCLGMSASGQTFSSGSTGADGDLSFTTPGTYVFDPKSYATPLNPANDGIFNFKTITIGAGVTVRLAGNVINSPIVWLAQGAVKIDGTIDLSGQNSFSASNTTQRTLPIPGSGGYPGGYPAVGGNAAGQGLGPAGGAAGTSLCNGGTGNPGGVSANQFVVPLIGGSGGGGFGTYSGGAGGGAILIASSVSIAGGGAINGSGGQATINNYNGGGGGSIRLVAPVVTISGALSVGGAQDACSGASHAGVVRVEAFQIGSLSVSGNLYTATPFGLFLNPAAIPAVSVVSVNGNPVATSPTGTFTVPDVTVNSSAPLTFAIKAANIPLGTVVSLVLFSENGPDQTILSTALAGTLASSTATATATLPPGFSKGFVKATF